MNSNVIFFSCSKISIIILWSLMTLFSCENPQDSIGHQQGANSLQKPTPNYQSNIHFTDFEKADIRPNSIVFVEDQYHLFYQILGNFDDSKWGHAMSKDLMSWEPTKTALMVDSLNQIKAGNVVVIYSQDKGFSSQLLPHLEAICDIGKSSAQKLVLATSTDLGKTWHTKGVITGLKTIPTSIPKLMWHEASERWVLIVTNNNEVQFYHTTDRVNWTYASSFGSKDGSHGNSPWETPSLFSLNVDDKSQQKKWVLIVSSASGHPTGGAATQYFVGDFDGKKFTNKNDAEKVLWLDWGSDNFGGIAFEHEKSNRKLFIGNIPASGNVNVLNKMDVANTFTTPSQLKLKDTYYGIKLFREPVDELKVLHSTKMSQQSIRLSDQENAIGTSFQTPSILSYEFTQNSNEGFTIELSNKRDEKMTIGYDGVRKMYFTQCKKADAGEITNLKEHISPRFATLPNMNVKIIVDVCSVECYIDDGLTVLTEYVVPKTNFDQMKIWGTTGRMMLKKMDLIQLKPSIVEN